MDDPTWQTDKEIDLKGKICPMTFVYTKIALEDMRKGQILKVILDYPPAFTNIPHSVKIQKLGKVLVEKDRGKCKVLWIERD